MSLACICMFVAVQHESVTAPAAADITSSEFAKDEELQQLGLSVDADASESEDDAVGDDDDAASATDHDDDKDENENFVADDSGSIASEAQEMDVDVSF